MNLGLREARRNAPFDVGLRIGPEQIGVEALVGDFLEAVDAVDVVYGADERGQTAMHAQDFVVDQRSDAHAVEDVNQILPGIGAAVLLHALIVETVHLGDLATLVVSSQ